MNVELLLNVPRADRFRCVKPDDPLTPTKLLSGYKEKEKGEQHVENVATGCEEEQIVA